MKAERHCQNAGVKPLTSGVRMFRGAITCIAVQAPDGTACSAAAPLVSRERAAAERPSSVVLLLRDVPVALKPSGARVAASGAQAAALDGRPLDAEPGVRPAAHSCVPMQSMQPGAAAAEKQAAH